ncbi:N-6 DNA methylase [Flavobacterium sp. Fl-318]|uniref:site-specific DNA-methyltransferase (adenine-specific) n=1 Tax=Flavobacterium cupriresistens TaxID=2893885 RepID=A0ABU4R9P9_9FLAO|nr:MULTISPECIES: N-6 DNA methylase [unclassified Flavobacterium]MDX6189307.1 N-6 DNA methylase [Flavobacterium sp. Fl-318]UFH41403.1 N-6 DNA methylase [Flavobacterium sp. F-323]
MKLKISEIKEIITFLGFKQQEGEKNIFYKAHKNHKDYIIKVDFDKENIDYGTKIKLGDLTTSNFENSENFVVLECVDRILQKGYPPEKLSLEYKWPMGRKEKGKLDILITNSDNKAYLMIECKTWGSEYENEKKKMQRDGGQLFSYFQQDKAAQYLCLYASRFNSGKIEFINDIVQVDEQWTVLSNQKEIFDHWNKNFKDNGIFESWANAYDIEIKALTRNRLKELTEEDSSRIFHQFAEILRHNVVSDKSNAFNKIFNLFLCKIVDEDCKPEEELSFQWLESDNNEELQKRLSDLYKKGMREYLTKEVTDYNDDQVSEKLYALDPDVREQIREMFTRVRLHKNNEFAFKEVFDEKSFLENASVVKEVVELLQPFQIRYGHKQQFLGDFFELLLSTGVKQEAGQFFTPVPIAKFIVSSLPMAELIKDKINNDETQFLPYIIDYAAGSGHFLTETMDEVQTIIENIDADKQRPSVRSKLKSWRESSFDWAYDYVYGIEADYRLVKTAKVSCFLNGDGLANVIHADGLDHFQKSIEYIGKLKEVNSDDSKDNGQFDILVANPPYSVSAFKNSLKNGDESFELFNKITDSSSEIECLFIERTKQLLKVGGFAGVILPSSILSKSGIYEDARDIIFKYFKIKSIVQFGKNTFADTGTTTSTFFMERRDNNDWKKIENYITKFFKSPKDLTINNIENAFSTYVENTFTNINIDDYISFISQNPNENVLEDEKFIEYKISFNELTEIKQFKQKKNFTDLDSKQQEQIINKMFFDKVISIEKIKILFFLLTYSQEVIIVNVGEKKAEKDFIGYEISKRRGYEGLKLYRTVDGTMKSKLYSETTKLDEKKVSTYIYKSFLNESLPIDSSLSKNVTRIELFNLMNFNAFHFEKELNLIPRKDVIFKTKWPLSPIKKLSIDIINGNTPSKQDVSYWSENDIPWLNIPEFPKDTIYVNSSNLYVSNKALEDRKVRIIPVNSVLISCTATIGRVAINTIQITTNQQINAIICNEEEIYPEYLGHFLNMYGYRMADLVNNPGVKHVNLGVLKSFKIPHPPKNIQQKIIDEITIIEKDVNMKSSILKTKRENVLKKYLE